VVADVRKRLIVCSNHVRSATSSPTRPDHPTRLEHGYQRAGALHLFTAFDTCTGKVYARTEMRKRLRISDFTDLDHLAEQLMAFVAEWNAHAHPFN
jgi:hypothetical protein